MDNLEEDILQSYFGHTQHQLNLILSMVGPMYFSTMWLNFYWKRRS